MHNAIGLFYSKWSFKMIRLERDKNDSAESSPAIAKDYQTRGSLDILL